MAGGGGSGGLRKTQTFGSSAASAGATVRRRYGRGWVWSTRSTGNGSAALPPPPKAAPPRPTIFIGFRKRQGLLWRSTLTTGQPQSTNSAIPPRPVCWSARKPSPQSRFCYLLVPRALPPLELPPVIRAHICRWRWKPGPVSRAAFAWRTIRQIYPDNTSGGTMLVSLRYGQTLRLALTPMNILNLRVKNEPQIKLTLKYQPAIAIAAKHTPVLFLTLAYPKNIQLVMHGP